MDLRDLRSGWNIREAQPPPPYCTAFRKDGASPGYGADAVAGVVNARTKQRTNGSVFNVQYELPPDGEGRYSVDVVWGRERDRIR